MRGVHKKFEKDLYDLYDGPAKEAMRKHLEHAGYEVTVPPENYGADLFSGRGSSRLYHEVEVSRQWKSGDHPFPTGSIPERKIRLVDMIYPDPLFFWMLRLDLVRALVFPATALLDEYLVEVPNRKIRSGEFFYRIPKHLGKEFDLNA